MPLNKNECTMLLKIKYGGYINTYSGYLSLNKNFRYKAKCQQDINKYFEDNNYPVLLFSIKNEKVTDSGYKVWFNAVYSTINQLEDPQNAFNPHLFKDAISQILLVDFPFYGQDNHKLSEAFIKKYGEAKK